MTPLEHKAHLVLIGQSLLDEWDARCKLLYEGLKIWVEGDKLRSGDIKLWVAARKLYDEGHKFRDEGNALWRGAVTAAGLTLSWSDADTCTLSNGEIYHDTTRT